jgi:hypothetical protein
MEVFYMNESNDDSSDKDDFFFFFFFLQGGVEDKEWHVKRGFYARHRHSAKTGIKK